MAVVFSQRDDRFVRTYTTHTHTHKHTHTHTHTLKHVRMYLCTVLFIKNWTMYGGQTGVRTVYVR